MTCLKHSTRTVVQIPPRTCLGVTHQQATLLALHFRSAAWTPCLPAPALLAASAVTRAVEMPGAHWDAWYFPAHAEHDVMARTGKVSLRRARLHAVASILTDDPSAAPWLLVLEERAAPGSRGRRVVVELFTSPFRDNGETAPVDPRALGAIHELPARVPGQANPPPDLTVDLVALGLIAPRSHAW